jgi:NAD+ kinase
MKLDVSVVRENETIFSDNALNDAVIHGYGDCIKMTVMCNGSRVTEFSGDGVILATPTGSTGYSMSAGGPIVEPDAENIIITPICPHAIGARSFVLGPDREVVVKMEKLHGRRAYLSLDGNSVLDLANGDMVHVRRSESYTLMIDLGLRSFYDVTYDKLR